MSIKNVLFALLLLLTIYWVAAFFQSMSGGSFTDVLTLLKTIDLPLWLTLGALTLIFYALDWIRFRSTLGILGHKLGPLRGLRLTCVSYFVSNLTPTADLHTPAMVYLLVRHDGVPLPEAVAASLTKSIYMTLWICVFSWAGLAFNNDIPLPEPLRISLPWLSAPLLLVVLLLAVMAFKPEKVTTLAQIGANRFAHQRWLHKILQGLAEGAASVAQIGRSTDRHHLMCHVASIAFLLVYVTIGWLLAQHFGFQLSAAQALTIFSTSLMVAYLSPIPGSIGVTEVATSYMLDPALTLPGMAVALGLRFLCWYCVVLPGAIWLLICFYRDGKRSSLPRINLSSIEQSK